jgi:hypothetical protein
VNNTSHKLQRSGAHYFPIHHIAPIEDYRVFLHFDNHFFQDAIDKAFTSGEAALTRRHIFSSDLLGISEKPVLYYAVGLMYPGRVVLTTDPDEGQRDLGMVSVHILSPSQGIKFVFLGGATFECNERQSGS